LSFCEGRTGYADIVFYAPSTLAKELFARKSTPFPGPPRSIGGDFDGCLAGAVSLPITGPTWSAASAARAEHRQFFVMFLRSSELDGALGAYGP